MSSNITRTFFTERFSNSELYMDNDSLEEKLLNNELINNSWDTPTNRYSIRPSVYLLTLIIVIINTKDKNKPDINAVET